MRILALETSDLGGAVAVLDDDRVVARAAIEARQRTAALLAPAIDDALRAAGWKPRDVELVAVTIGPGSFTGLRVGVTTAKTFAYATGCAVIGVDTLETIAQQSPPRAGAALWAVIDAQRQQLFAAKFVGEAETWRLTSPAQIVDADVWLAGLSPHDVVTGSGLKRLLPRLGSQPRAEEVSWLPQAETVGQLGWRKFLAAGSDDLWKLAPRYLRASAAEEKAAEPAKTVR